MKYRLPFHYLHKFTSPTSNLTYELCFLVCVLVLLAYCNTSHCALIEEVPLPPDVLDQLDDFFLRGHQLRIEALKDAANRLDDKEVLADLLALVESARDEATFLESHDQPSKLVLDDTFSNHPSGSTETVRPRNRKNYFSLEGLFLFIFFTLFGFFFINFPVIMYPVVYYREKILALLTSFDENPELYMKVVTELYYEAIEMEIIPE